MDTTRAIQEWETKTGRRACDTAEVRLICWNPPISKMDLALGQLANCRKLSLASNAIQKISNLTGMPNLEVLSIGRNNIRKLSGLDGVAATLKELWVSYNFIEKLEGLAGCVALHSLFISNNKVKNWDEVNRLAQLPALRNVLMTGNPIYEDRDNSSSLVIKKAPQIEVLDGNIVSDQVRKQAEDLSE